MLILRNRDASPFGRKVNIAVAVLGLSDEIRIEFADTNDETDSLRGQNPLGKIPTLILDDGTVLFDSRVIVEYLDARAGGGRIIPRDERRFTALTMQALADGIMEASVIRVYEVRYRPEDKRHAPWTERQAEKVARALARLEAEPPSLEGDLHIGHIAVACAVGYQDLRFDGTWRGDHPRLVAWLDRFAERVPAFQATKVDP